MWKLLAQVTDVLNSMKSMEELKKLEELQNSDKRNLHFCIIDHSTGKQRPLDVKDIYSSVERIELSEAVPEDIRSQFNVARNLAVYSWFSYSFHQISELKAFSTVEMALRSLLGKHKHGFRGLTTKAVNSGLIKDLGFSHIEKPENSNSTEYSAKLQDIMPALRNSLAHGNTTLHPGSVSNLRICADFINQLYEKKFNNQMQPIAESDG